MPACITHNCFAQDVLEELDQPGIDKNRLDLPAYYWGAQGPDFLFCHRYLQAAVKREVKSLKEYGSALHKTPPSATLAAMREFIKKRPDPSYLSYALGFLCHYALDSTAHPYVNCRAQSLAQERPHENPGSMHGEIEAALDAIVLRWRTGKLPSQVKLSDMFPKNEGVQRKIACLYKELLFAVYGAQVSEAQLYEATKDARFVFACLTDRSGLKRSLFSLLERGRTGYVTSHLVPLTEDPEPDYANLSRHPWQWNGDSGDTDFFQLYEKAKPLAMELMAAITGGGDFKEITRDRPFG